MISIIHQSEFATGQYRTLDINTLTEQEAARIAVNILATCAWYIPIEHHATLSTRLGNILKENKISSLEDVAQVPQEKFKIMRKMGRKSHQELQEICGRHGLILTPWDEIGRRPTTA